MRFRPIASALTGLALSGGVAVGTPATAAADCGCWHYVRAEGATANTTFEEVSAPSFGTALAAGSRGDLPLVAYWNGVRWRESGRLPVAADTVMEGVAASSVDDGWVVGYTPAGLPQTAHWTGGERWRAVPIPAHAPSYPRAVDARSGDDVWIVGAAGHPYTRAAAWHWDGRAWRPMPVPTDPGAAPHANSELVAVSAVGTDDVWAVGGSGLSGGREGTPSRGRATSARALVAHWDGRAWTRVALPEPAADEPLDVVLADVVALAPDDVWAVGTASAQTDLPLIRHWNGRMWATVPIPAVRGRLHSVAGDGRGGVWVAGQTSTGSALLAHWNGGRWDVSGAPTPGDPDPGEGTASRRGSGAVRGLAHAPGTSYLWAVGAYARPGSAEPVRYPLTWTNAPHHR